MMTLPRFTASMLGAALLAACTTDRTEPARGCTDEVRAGLAGRNIGEVSLPSSLPSRIIIPDSVVTEEADPRRLNIHVDDKGWILRTSCG